jgi:hypothetical protein
MGTPASQYLSLELHYNNPEGIKGEPGSVLLVYTCNEGLNCAVCDGNLLPCG